LNTFSKSERLTHERIISRTFSEGRSVKKYPFILLFREEDLRVEHPCQVMMSVGKRRFKKAVDRNRIKRLMREAWRMNKSSFFDPITKQNKQMSIILLYVGNKMLTFEESESKIKELALRFEKEIEPTDPQQHEETQQEN
jgi:ribonuclease P protein component